MNSNELKEIMASLPERFTQALNADRTHVGPAIGYRPTISFDEGLVREVDWALARRKPLV